MSDSSSPARRGMPWLVVAGVLVAAVSLRGPIVAPTPVMRAIEHDLGIGSAAAGLLTTVPVLMFAVLTPLAVLMIHRAGPERALLLSLCGVLIGTVVRAFPGFGWMLAGTVIIGAAITVGNVVVPVIIRREVPPERVGFITAAYAATLNVGSLITSLGTAPLAAWVGWPIALLCWSVLTIAGVALWGVHLRRGTSDDIDRYSGPPHTTAIPVVRDFDPATITGPIPALTRSPGERRVLRLPITWLLMILFALQCTMYYALTTWLPSITADVLTLDAAGAGAIASLFQGVGILGAFVVPLLGRFTPRAVPPLTICVCWLVVTFGLLLAPHLLWVWVSVGAIGHAGGFVVVFAALVAVARNDAEAAAMSAMIQGGGYAMGAFGAPIMGALHEATGTWTPALFFAAGIAVLYTAAMLVTIAVSRRS